MRWLLLLLAVVEIYRLIPPPFSSAIQGKSHIYMSSPRRWRWIFQHVLLLPFHLSSLHIRQREPRRQFLIYSNHASQGIKNRWATFPSNFFISFFFSSCGMCARVSHFYYALILKTMMPIDFNFFFLPLYRTKNHLTENLNGVFFSRAVTRKTSGGGFH